MIEQQIADYLAYCESHYLAPQNFDNLNFYLKEQKEKLKENK